MKLLYALLAIAAVVAYFQPPLRFVAIGIVLGCAIWFWGWLCVRFPLAAVFITGVLRGLLGRR